MKKAMAGILTVVLLLCLTGCQNNEIPQSVEAVALPLKGFHAVNEEIIIEVEEPLSFFQQEFVAVKNAYRYQDGSVFRLEPVEIEIKIKGDVLRKQTEEVTIPIKYFICEKTVYPYVNVNPQEYGISYYELASIPGDPENILVYSGGVIGVEPILYNVKSGEYRRLFTQTESCQPAFPAGIDANGNYIAVYGGTKRDVERGNVEYYVLNLKNGKTNTIPLPGYDKNKYTACNTFPVRFVGNELLVTYEIEYAPNREENYFKSYYYNPETGNLRKWNNPIPFEGNLSWNSNDYFTIKTDWETGSIARCNIKTEQFFSYAMAPETEITGLPNPSGRFLLGGYKERPIAYWDDNGNAVYENTTDPYTPVFIDMEKGKTIDIAQYVKGFTIDTYKGYAVTLKQWIDETHLLITYQNEDEYYTDILDLSDAMA